MLIKTKDEKGLSAAVDILRGGGVVICPSDTVYGLLADAKNPDAVAKLITFKNRPAGKPISVFVDDIKSAETFVFINPRQKEILNELLPGPFTAILPSKHTLDSRLESERGNLGIRIPDYKFIRTLVTTFGSPLTATSANLAGRPPHYSLDTLLREVSKEKQKLIDLALDGGKLPRNKPSTVIDLTESRLKVLRRGDIIAAKSGSFLTKTPDETEKTASFILSRILQKENKKAVVFILQGEMGVGKTVFVKGAAKLLDVQKIVSPTFVVYYEYDVQNQTIKKLVHADLYNIEDSEEFRHLGIDKYLYPGNLLFIEWGEKAGDLVTLFKHKAVTIMVSMKYISEFEREIIVYEDKKA